MAGSKIGVAAYFIDEFSYRNHIICINHKENTGFKHVYTNIPKLQ